MDVAAFKSNFSVIDVQVESREVYCIFAITIGWDSFIVIRLKPKYDNAILINSIETFAWSNDSLDTFESIKEVWIQVNITSFSSGGNLTKSNFTGTFLSNSKSMSIATR